MSTFTQILNGKHPLSAMMMNYIATPWCECQDTKKWSACSKCNPSIMSIKKQGVQSHGGDLFQHSQWCALYLTMWLTVLLPGRELLHKTLNEIKNSKLFNSICGPNPNKKLQLIQICGFFHDIGKGGDNIFDMYEDNKYGKHKTDDYHPTICKKIILNPGNRYDGVLKPILVSIFEQFKKPVLLKKLVALCAGTHWTFGKTNIPTDRGGLSIKQYIDQIDKDIEDVGLSSINRRVLFKLCMVISCADIASAYNNELFNPEISVSKMFNGIVPSTMTHQSIGGAWVKFGMNKTHVKLMRNVLRDLTASGLSKKKKNKLKTSRTLKSERKYYKRCFHTKREYTKRKESIKNK